MPRTLLALHAAFRRPPLASHTLNPPLFPQTTGGARAGGAKSQQQRGYYDSGSASDGGSDGDDRGSSSGSDVEDAEDYCKGD